MTTKELITELNKFDEEMTIAVSVVKRELPEIGEQAVETAAIEITGLRLNPAVGQPDVSIVTWEL
jgi:hypothetical protein